MKHVIFYNTYAIHKYFNHFLIFLYIVYYNSNFSCILQQKHLILRLKHFFYILPFCQIYFRGFFNSHEIDLL